MKHGKKHGMSEHELPEHIDVMGHGSPHATHKIHGGSEKVPRELGATSGPGVEGKFKPFIAKSQFEGGSATSGKAKGMKRYTEE